jgi:hypothetical protein
VKAKAEEQDGGVARREVPFVLHTFFVPGNFPTRWGEMVLGEKFLARLFVLLSVQ